MNLNDNISTTAVIISNYQTLVGLKIDVHRLHTVNNKSNFQATRTQII